VAARWGRCAGLIAVPYVLLARAFGPRIGSRTYRYAA
jgi:hypothetical protein